MNEQSMQDPDSHHGQPAAPALSLNGDIIRGAQAIADELGCSPRQVFHLVETESIPVRKEGGRLVASRTGLRRHYAKLIAGEVA
jgi:hypothetical protein